MGKCMYLRKGETHTVPSAFKIVSITADNIEDYFTVTNDTYYFKGDGAVFTSNNSGVNNSTASTVLTAKQDISILSFDYSYSSEANYDKFTLKVGSTTVEDGVSGATTNKSYSGAISSGNAISFTYAKDSSQHKNDDKCTFSNMYITIIKTDILASYLSVGSTVKLMENDTAVEYIVVNQGIPSNSSLYDESCNGTWLLRKDIYGSRAWHSSNSNSYKASTIHSYLNSTFLGLFDSNTQNTIKQIKIPYINGTGGSAVASGANGLSAKIFLLSGYEVGVGDESYVPQDGVKLDYFNQNASADSKRIAYLNDSATYWWLRSPHTNNTSRVLGINTNGSLAAGDASYSADSGIRPALILPSNALFDKDTLILKGVV